MNLFDLAKRLKEADTLEKKKKLIDELIQEKVPEEYIRMVINTL